MHARCSADVGVMGGEYGEAWAWKQSAVKLHTRVVIVAPFFDHR